MSDKSAFVISRDDLKARLGEPGLAIVDASWYLPAAGRNGRDEYDAAHIPGAVFFDQDVIADKDSGLPHTLPSSELFARHVGAMGITADETIVVYDGPGMFSAPRVWWMFRVMGVKNVLVLDGGFDGWKAANFPVTDEVTKIAATLFTPSFNAAKVVDFAEMSKIVDGRSSQIADARAAGRFTGRDAEPREGMRSGHMPGARNVPVGSLSENGQLKSLDSLREIFASAGVDLNKPVVTSCGSGVTAAVITLALTSLGHEDNRLYDGSWSEWGSRQDTPVVTGEAD
ncbi:3-mercaptopyruvate sulfurtransferase [Brucella pseudogrignonensis]|jgi:thiosulfate/3-mercaptopyruvate sulfurtransferase|uniref:3-mercaptopyruvate sulfurtransferase n=1 Tax=Brucella pseudogrignonensis TaxID=419475 RepID=UPI000DDA2E80|nr:3-mercaptopyruvate sulfurtransferase [Brucella pseudogrignonensis]MBK0021036.1 3-mercaptopyruvate sulfurtransferase [Ochrobactrum sp. S45]MBK0042226.1 3-mercaptopyruvate sulfurtransferase [Ochrobactrum sp. S46]UKK93443.1 3-mercaptopyruvate sulfurtransferase [Brucella pseudogrignonensis]